MSTSLVSLAALVDAFNPVTPQLRVGAIIAQHDRILLVEHHKRGQRYWVLPGGRLQGNETLDAALQRELREELGLEARVGRLAIVCETLATEKSAWRRCGLSITAVAQASSMPCWRPKTASVRSVVRSRRARSRVACVRSPWIMIT